MKTTLISISTVIVLAACGTANQSSSIKSISTSEQISEGTFKLYKEAGHKPNVGCDVFRRLVLKNSEKGPVAVLDSTVSGLCKIMVMPEHREYELAVRDAGCGSKEYFNKNVGAGFQGINILDHRTRVCEDRIAATIIVNETKDFAGALETLYSYDGVPPAERMCLQVIVPMFNPETKQCIFAKNSCEADDLRGQGFQNADENDCVK